MPSELLFRQESYHLVGACFEVYRDKGCGFLEPVYHECLEIELAHRGIPFTSRQRLELRYRGQLLRHHYEPDFICHGQIILEVKAVTALTDEHRAQVHNYLRATGYPLGLLVNFGHYPKTQVEGIATTQGRYAPQG
jgi:GxxExxY protein